MTFVETTPVITPPVEQLEEMKPIKIKIRKKRAPKHDFKNGFGRVFAHRHDHGKGWVADTAKVEDTVYVGPRCEIFDHAIVKGNTRLEGHAKISGHAVVSGRVIVRQNAHIYGAAVVRDATELNDFSRVGGNAHISGTSRLFDAARVYDSAQLFSVTLVGPCQVSGAALIVRSNLRSDSPTSFVEIKGDCSVIHGTIHGNVLVDRRAQIIRSTLRCYLPEKLQVTDFAIVADESNVGYAAIIKEHAVVIRSSIYTQYGNDTPATPQIGGRAVLQHQTFRSRVELQNYLNLLAQHGGRLGAAQIMPNGQIAGFPARQLPQPATPPGPRRIMRLQEVGV